MAFEFFYTEIYRTNMLIVELNVKYRICLMIRRVLERSDQGGLTLVETPFWQQTAHDDTDLKMWQLNHKMTKKMRTCGTVKISSTVNRGSLSANCSLVSDVPAVESTLRKHLQIILGFFSRKSKYTLVLVSKVKHRFKKIIIIIMIINDTWMDAFPHRSLKTRTELGWFQTRKGREPH